MIFQQIWGRLWRRELARQKKWLPLSGGGRRGRMWLQVRWRTQSGDWLQSWQKRPNRIRLTLSDFVISGSAPQGRARHLSLSWSSELSIESRILFQWLHRMDLLWLSSCDELTKSFTSWKLLKKLPAGYKWGSGCLGCVFVGGLDFMVVRVKKKFRIKSQHSFLLDCSSNLPDSYKVVFKLFFCFIALLALLIS